MPSPYPSYDNRMAPVLADGVHAQAGGSGGGPTGQPGPPDASACNAARRAVTRARRRVRSLKRGLRRTRSARRRPALKRSIRRWNRRLRRRRGTARRRCAGIARTAGGGRDNRPGTFRPPADAGRRPFAKTATTAGGAYFRAGIISCDPGYMHMYAGPDMRSQGNYVQGVAFRVALFRLSAGRWVYDNEFTDYWWGAASYNHPPAEYYDSSDQARANDQGFYINVPGTYRFAVRYHWWPNTAGGRQDTSWNWAGIHQTGGQVHSSCTYT